MGTTSGIVPTMSGRDYISNVQFYHDDSPATSLSLPAVDKASCSRIKATCGCAKDGTLSTDRVLHGEMSRAQAAGPFKPRPSMKTMSCPRTYCAHGGVCLV